MQRSKAKLINSLKKAKGFLKGGQTTKEIMRAVRKEEREIEQKKTY